MKKLSLDVEELEVVSFEIMAPTPKKKGTVRGHGFAWSDDSVCPTVTDHGARCRPY